MVNFNYVSHCRRFSREEKNDSCLCTQHTYTHIYTYMHAYIRLHIHTYTNTHNTHNDSSRYSGELYNNVVDTHVGTHNQAQRSYQHQERILHHHDLCVERLQFVPESAHFYDCRERQT